MHPELKAAARILGFIFGIFGAICLGAAGMSVVNVIAQFYDDSPSNFLVIAAVTLVLSVISGFLCLVLFTWAAEEPGS